MSSNQVIQLPTKILVPTDFTSESRAAVEYAASLGEPLGAEVDLLHVQRSPDADPQPSFVLFDPIGEYPLYWEAPRLAPREEVLSEFAHSDAGHRMAECLKELDERDLDARGRIAFGDPSDPAETIIAVAGDAMYDLIVMATHGKSHLFSHGVAEMVVRHAPCPVVTIRVRPE